MPHIPNNKEGRNIAMSDPVEEGREMGKRIYKEERKKAGARAKQERQAADRRREEEEARLREIWKRARG